jgi:hypothetical protein
LTPSSPSPRPPLFLASQLGIFATPPPRERGAQDQHKSTAHGRI